MKTLTLLSLLTAFFYVNAKAQLIDTVPLKDGFYLSTKNSNNTPFFLPKPNDVDVRFYKRIWRDIDVNDPENEIFVIPGSTLIESMVLGLKTGIVSAYDPRDESFKTKLSISQALATLTDSVLVSKFDAEGNQTGSTMKLNDFDPNSIRKFRIKEDIFYNKQRGKIETRIIGIAPLKKFKTSDGVDANMLDQPAFWLYFPQARYLLVNIDVTDPDKGIYDLSMDDIFIQRRFKSKIIRESKPNGERIADYTKTDEEADKEADKIEGKIKSYKSDTWAYPIAPTQEQPSSKKQIKKSVLKNSKIID